MNLCPITPYTLYPQNGDRVLTIDFVTSFHPVYSLNVSRKATRCDAVSGYPHSGDVCSQAVLWMTLYWHQRPGTRAYSKRVFRTNCALRIKTCAPRISSGIYFLSTS